MPAIAFSRPPNFPPATSYEYSNTNHARLGAAPPTRRDFDETT
ncbi:hypothetical protein ACFYNW_01425 [Streptomyces virginiae]